MFADNEKKLNGFLIFLTIPLFFIPRINLISLSSGQTAGLRIDDIILFLVFLTILLTGRIFSLNLKKSYLIYFLFVLFLFISYFSNLYNSKNFLGEPSILYPIRYIEYFIFFIIGSMFRDNDRFIKLILIIALTQIIFILLQYLGILPSFTSTDGVTWNKPSGLTGGPWEVSIILTLCFAVYINHFNSKKYLLFTLIIIFTLLIIYVYILGSRTSIIAFILLSLLVISKNFIEYFKYYFFPKILLVTFLLLITSTYFLATSNLINNEQIYEQEASDCLHSQEQINCNKNILVSRSGSLFSMDNINIFKDFYIFVRNNVDDKKIPIGRLYDNNVSLDRYGHLYFSKNNDVDLSWLMRTEKWIYGFSIFQDRLPYSAFIGIGPGSVGPSFDGNWFRLIVENGLISLFIILSFFTYVVLANYKNFLPVFVISVSMIFIDAFLAYKSVSLLLFILGYYTFYREKN